MQTANTVLADTECDGLSPILVSRTGLCDKMRQAPRKTVGMGKLTLLVIIIGVFYYLQCLALFILTSIILPIVLPILLMMKLLKWLLECYVKYKKIGIPLSEDDAVWQQDSPTNFHLISALMFLEGTPDIDQLRETISERLVYSTFEDGTRKCPRLTQFINQQFGQYIWEEDKQFDICKHVLPWEGKIPTSMMELEDIMASLMSKSLCENLPPWQFQLIPTAFSSNMSALLLRIHHSVADGVALSRILVSNLFDTPPVAPEPTNFSMHQKMYVWLKAIFVAPFIVISKGLSFVDKSSLHGQKLCGEKSISSCTPLKLNLVKQIKNLTGTTINDVMVSCFAGAFRNYLKIKGIINPTDFRASLPVDVRTIREERLKFGNEFAIVFLKLPVSVEGNLARLHATKRRMDFIKVSAEPIVSSYVVRMLMWLPEFISKTILDFYGGKTTCVLSNVPGPQWQLTINGLKVKGGFFVPPTRASIGIGLSIFSYNGMICSAVQADKNVISDTKLLMVQFERCFKDLCKELNLSDENENL